MHQIGSHITRNDYVWWILAALLGLLAHLLPGLSDLGSTTGLTHIIANPFLLISAAIIGYLNPMRVWRWGIASVVLVPVWELIQIAPNSGVAESIPYLIVKIPIYAIMSVPAFAGAYLGALLKRGDILHRLRQGAAGDARVVAMSFCLGAFVSWIPLFMTQEDMPFKLWMLGLFLVAFLIGAWRSKNAWRWAVAVGLGLPTVVYIRVLTDATSTHNLWPFEVWFAIIFPAPSAFGGVYAGVFVARILEKRSNGGVQTPQ